jgi:hypothetical protein
MTTTSILTVTPAAAVPATRPRIRAGADAPVPGAVGAPTLGASIGMRRVVRVLPRPRADDRTGDDRQAVIGDPPTSATPPADPLPGEAPGGSEAEDQDLSARRMADTALLGLAAILIVAFLWMCTGKDDLSTPLLIAMSWSWHALAAAAIAAAMISLWQLVRATSWTVRLVFAGILLLNWVLESLFG